MVAPSEFFDKTRKTCVPLFKAAGRNRAILLTPLPRSWKQSCCEDLEHVTNRNDDTLVIDLLSGLDRLRRQCKDQLFLLKVRGLTVLNTVQLIANQANRTTPQEALYNW